MMNQETLQKIEVFEGAMSDLKVLLDLAHRQAATVMEKANVVIDDLVIQADDPVTGNAGAVWSATLYIGLACSACDYNAAVMAMLFGKPAFDRLKGELCQASPQPQPNAF